MNDNFEVKLSCLLLGAIGFMSGLVVLFPSDPLVGTALLAVVDAYAQNTFGMLMIIHSTMLVAGALTPLRKVRQYGLIIGSVCWMAMFGVFVQIWSITATTVLIALFAIYGYLLLALDVKNKRRDGDATCDE